MSIDRARFRPSMRRLALALVGIAWLGGAAAVFASVGAYGATAGEATETAPRWPESSRLARDAARPTLVMLVHPKCPCSVSSVRELERLLARVEGAVRAYVLVARPDGAPDDWDGGPVVAVVEAIDGVEVVIDEGLREAGLFGASTSGHVALYGTDDALLFAGGITDAKGHEGSSSGGSAIEAILHGLEVVEATRTATYGCPLAGRGSR